MNRTTVEVYAGWMPIDAPLLIGQLTFSETNRGSVFSFAYDTSFLNSDHRLQIDPLLTLHSGELYNDSTDRNFRIFLDSSPDRWGRILILRRSAIEYNKGFRPSARLTELDYLLGVHDSYRMGGIRFKTADSKDFLDNNSEFSAPPMTSLSELEHTAIQIEQDADIDSKEYYHWLRMLISPGSSLGGAYDLNPNTDKQGLHLNITDTDNRLDYKLAFEVISFFRINHAEAIRIYDEVLNSVKGWQVVANRLAISRGEQVIKQGAFNV